MILDQLAQADLYRNVTKRMHLAFGFLRRPDLASLAVGKYPIDGENVFALVQEYQTKLRENAIWEAHRTYIDVQYIASGIERMGYAYIDTMRITKEYDPASDYLLLEGTGNDFVMTSGMFAIFAPHDAHQPTMAVDQPAPVRKIVVKVRVD